MAKFLVHVIIQRIEALKELWAVKEYSASSWLYTTMNSLLGVSCAIITLLLSEECGHIPFFRK